MSEPLHASSTPTPWEVIPSTEHHGPYIVSPYGSTLADLYVMSNPTALSVRNGGDSKPILFPDADENASLIVRAVNSHEDLVAMLDEARLQIEYLHEKYQPTSTSEGVLARIAYALSKAKAQP